MRVLFLTDGPQIPSGRFRVEQFIPSLEARGVQCTVRYAYGTGYNDVIGKPWAEPYKVACRLRRAAHTVFSRPYDLLFLQRTAIPMTALPERLRALGGTPTVFDFDDAIYLGPGGRESPMRAKAFRTAVDLTDHVIAGNRHLAEQAGHPEKTTVIPTVVDTDRFVPAPEPKRTDEFVVGWMGTASNFDSLRPVVPSVLAAIRELPNARLRIVSNARLPGFDDDPKVEQVRWSPHGEIRELQSFDVGLMPLNDTPENWGKCGFKMIQYMACGTSVVASAVGANNDIFEGSEAGFLVSPGGDWREPIRTLASDPMLRSRMGANGRRHAVAHYSIQRATDAIVRIFDQVTRLRAPRSRSVA